MLLFGRKKILTNYRVVDDSNISIILSQAYEVFLQNASEIEYLYDYYKGRQTILGRTKLVRPEINNRIVENHAFNIVQFRSGYLLEKPVQYVANKEDIADEELPFLNGCMSIEGKESKDKNVANARCICGTAYRLCLPNKFYQNNGDDSPFKIYTIKSNQAFVVYSSGLGEEPLIGVVVSKEIDDNGITICKLQAYTKDKYYVFNQSFNVIEISQTHTLGRVPLIEYPLNEERLGAFEIVIRILDAINTIESNRVDGIEQFIQAILVFKNIEVTKEMLKKLQELGAINISDTGEVKANVEYLQQELNQTQVQTLHDCLVEYAYRIAGVPTRNGSGSGDTGQATIMRDGWNEIEAKIQEDELSFKDSDRQFLALALNITKTLTGGTYTIRLMDLDIKFTRRIYENTYQKAQTLDLMLKNGMIAPRLAFVSCGLFSDPEGAYNESKPYIEKAKATVTSGEN